MHFESDSSVFDAVLPTHQRRCAPHHRWSRLKARLSIPQQQQQCFLEPQLSCLIFMYVCVHTQQQLAVRFGLQSSKDKEGTPPYLPAGGVKSVNECSWACVVGHITDVGVPFVFVTSHPQDALLADVYVFVSLLLLSVVVTIGSLRHPSVSISGAL